MDPVIYLKGVLAPEMKSILQFMYLGQATFYRERMNDFVNIAKSLEIKEICKDVNCDVDDSSQDQSSNENMEPNIGISDQKDAIMNSSDEEGVVEHKEKKVISHINEAGLYPCSICDKQFSSKRSLKQHNKSAHEGIRFPCNDCDYKGSRKEHLVIHIQSVHEGIKYPCNFCDYQFNYPQDLMRHKKRKH